MMDVNVIGVEDDAMHSPRTLFALNDSTRISGVQSAGRHADKIPSACTQLPVDRPVSSEPKCGNNTRRDE
jgi:hypothetical protein